MSYEYEYTTFETYQPLTVCILQCVGKWNYFVWVVLKVSLYQVKSIIVTENLIDGRFFSSLSFIFIYSLWSESNNTFYVNLVFNDGHNFFFIHWNSISSKFSPKLLKLFGWHSNANM